MKPSPLEAALPLSPLQEGMLFHALYDEEGVDVYTIQVAFGLGGALDADRLRAACGALLERHPVLRAGFQQRKTGEPVQLVRRRAAAPWTDLDLSALPADEQQDRLARYRTDDRARGFDMGRPPLIRFTLARLADDEHVMILTYHHILLDAWSFQIVLRDLLVLYAAGGDGGALPPPVPFARYLSWLAGQDRAASEDAWAETLAGLGEPTLVAPGADAAGGAAMPRMAAAELTEEATGALTAAARAAGLTLNSVVLAAWSLVLGGLTGRWDVVFGQTVSGRPAGLDDVEDIVGLLINAAPVRVRLDPREALGALAARIQREQSALEPHHHVGLADVQRRAGLGELFDTSVAFGNAPMKWDDVRAPVGGLRLTAVEGDGSAGSTHYPLSLMAVPGRRLRLEVNYRQDLYERADAESVAARVRHLLETWLTAPDTPVGRVALLTPDEAHRVLDTWNDTAHPVASTTLPRMFAEQAARTPDAVALVAEDATLTYAETADLVRALAARLRGHGVRHGDTVAVALPRSAALVVALHAVQAAGAAYVPVDPDLPAERIGWLLEDAAPALLLTETATAAALPETDAPRLLLDAPGEPVEDVSGAPEGPQGASAAYVIFTSGSTGRPKGVMVPHAAVVNRLRWMQDRYPIGPGDRVLQKTPCGFDVSVWEFFWPLHTGATLVVARPDGHKDPAYLAELVRRENVSVAHFVPSMLQVFLQEPAAAHCTGLRRVFSSGEALPVATQNRFLDLLGSEGAELHNLYGPTEAAVDVTFWQCRPVAGAGSVPIGRPVWNTRLLVLDKALLPVPPGVPGELYLAGAQLAHGYAHRPVLTAERFVADPYGEPGARMYRTGDVVRWTADGVLEYLGRSDDQVKIRGLRVELGEIDTVLAAHASVAQVATVVREDQPGVKRLVAYVVAAGTPDAGRRTAALTEHAAGALPEYMVPGAVVWLDRLPLTPNGKLDRRALPAPAAAAGSGGRAPSGHAEETLCALFAEVLGVAGPGVDDSFFDLGGDSIVSIQLVARARKSGLVITPKDVFTHRTVAALARVARTAADRPAEHPDAGVGPLKPTPVMHWLRERGGPSDGFHQSVLVRVPHLGTTGRLARAVQRVLDRHDALRMRRLATGPDGRDWALDIAAPGTVRAEDLVRRRDISGLGPDALRAAVAEESAAARDRLDPAARRMAEAVWFDAGPGADGLLLLTVHHLAVDGVSWRVLLPDLHRAWEGAADGGGTAGLDPVHTSFRTWSERLHMAARDPWHTDRLSLWEEILSGGDPMLAARPLDPARDVYGTARSLTMTLPAAYTEPLLTGVPAAFRTGVNDILLTALALAVESWRRARGTGGAGGVLVDLEGHGREEIADGLDLSRTAGWFTSLYPVRVDPGTGDLNRAVKRVKEQLRAIPGNGIGYGLLRHLNPDTAGALATHPAPQIGFNYLGRISGPGEGVWDIAAEADAVVSGTDDGLPMPHVIEVNAATHDLPDGPRLTATWSWPGALLTEADAAELGEAWFAALRDLVAHTARPGAGGLTPSDVPLVDIGQDELEALEATWPAGPPAGLLPATPLQEGLLHHARYDSGAADVYHVQLVAELEGALDTGALRRACQALTDRHEVLRTGFLLLDSGEPVQAVAARVEVPWAELDLTRPDGSSPRPRLDAFLARDRRARFAMDRPPLLRFTLLRTGADRYALVFTSHHILTDGWSTSVLLRDLFTLYLSGGDPAALPRPVPAREYAAWLAGRDREAAREAWRTALKGLPGPSLIAPGHDTGTLTTLPERITAELPQDLTAALTAAARTAGVTLNTVVQGVWGLLLAELTGRRDVVFGATVSVRPPELPGIEDMVGLYINTVPVRVEAADPAEPLRALLVRVQAAQAELADHHHLGPAGIQRLVGAGPLYDTSIVFENYPRAAALPAVPGAGLRVADFYGRDAYHYPLKLMAVPGDRMYLEVSHRAELVDAGQAAAVLDRLTALLTAFATDPETPTGALPGDALPVPAVRAVPDARPAPAAGPSARTEALCALFASVLGREHHGADEDFFDAGGDSLRALRLAGRARAALGVEPDLVQIHRHRTPAALAAVLVPIQENQEGSQ
ncbi:amino acid adenylation domain-containing protein [Streptomyces laurentii]|uniref:amino acid adenylation domain-containing protein n=1 Tax=Streptomyces laurentii TaxID=39478 RepID=UPI0033F5ADDD